jgi:hypothetical protein
MATRTLAMGNSPSTVERHQGFTRRLITLLLFAASIAVWSALLYRYQTNISITLMTVFTDIAIALAAGLGARLAFYDRNWFVRFVSALASMIIGMYVVGYFTHWKMGIGPLVFWRKTYDWLEIAQLSGGVFVVILALSAWRRSASRQQVEVPARNQRLEVYEEPAYEPPVQLPQIQRPARRSRTGRPSRASKPVRLKVPKQARAIERSAPQEQKVSLGHSAKSSRSNRRKKLFRRKPELQISIYEEHRCPYCLEDVKRNDPRGVKECSICHTLHHADCWDVTGMCQVPHLN